ncbi:alpha/beta fold hydrolase [Oleiagrimonas sp. C23AA]|uniref:alpha/beta fold hydrolase n=1 Tax=Oleiagrimonas sp. C23AA TaxID=2719047 RepID=UPI0014204AD0|nr:alpha/beta fold hydrolase [Oleiagrimonas sp. C23AA]NII10799.1 alpha/beta fold hydrolase [Oleiagrimonas sp. C23AA]
MMIDANGTQLHVSQRGDGELAVVFLHYWGGTARTWSPVLDALPADLKAVALDARGWGQSARPENGYDMVTQADDVAAVIAQLGLSRYVLVGHSMGGKVAQLLASRCPIGLQGVLLVAPSPAQGKALAADEKQAMLGAYTHTQAVAATLDHVLAGSPLPAALREQVIADSVAGAASAKSHWPAMGLAQDVSADLGRIDVPVHILVGEHDRVDAVSLMREVVQPSIRGADLQVVSGAGHLLPLEAPQAVAAAVLDLVGRAIHAAGHGTARPEALPAAFDDALNAGDLERVMALFDPRAVMRMTDGTTVAEGHAALRGGLAGLLSMRPTLQNRVRRVLVSDDVALLLLDWTIRLHSPDQGEITQRGTATQVAQRGGDGQWRLRISNPLGLA